MTLVASACSSSHGHAGGPATSSSVPATTTTTEAPPQYAPSPYAWDRVTSAGLAVGGGGSATLSAVLAPQLSGSWLLFGSRLDPTGSPTATVWSSPDGNTWTAAPLPSGGDAGQVAGAAQYKTATVAVGSTGTGDGRQAAVWFSPGMGAPFEQQPLPATGGPSAMTLVTAGALGMFATGTVAGRFAIWSSTNGRHWSELPAAEKVITGSAGARVNALIANGDYVYAAGSVQSGANPQAALWVTADGIDWHMVSSAAPSFTGPGGRVIYSLAPLGSTGLVAVGAVNPGAGWVPASWISPDGQSWSLPSTDFPELPHRSSADPFGASGGTAARSVSAVPTLAGPGSVVAASAGPRGQAAWRSKDGLHWVSLAMPVADALADSWRAEAVAATADTTVVLDTEPGQPYVLTDRAPSGGGTAAGSATSGAGASGSVAPTGQWSQPSADPRVFGPVRPQAVPVSLRSVAGRLVLTVDLFTRPQTIGPATVTSLVLSSTDGSQWAALPAGTAVPGQPPRLPAPGALATHLPGGWVAVASTAGGPAASWISADGSAWRKAAVLSGPEQGNGAAPTSTSGTGSAAGATPVTVNGLCTARLPSASTPATSAPPGTSSKAATSPSAGSSTPATTLPGRYVIDTVGAATTVTLSAAGSGGSGTPPPSVVTTRSASAWSSATGVSWRPAPVNSAPPPGGTSSLSGCVAAGAGLAAFGSATAAGGAPQPALWRSTDGTAWTRVPVSAFGNGPASPLVSLALKGTYWLAAGNPDPTADPLQAGVVDGRGPAAVAPQDAGVGPTPSVDDGRDVLWLSVDGGSSWQTLDTATAPWLASQQTQIDLVGFASPPAVHAASTSTTSSSSSRGSSSPESSTAPPPTAAGGTAAPSTPVVVGVVDGQLAVWTGTRAASGTGG